MKNRSDTMAIVEFVNKTVKVVYVSKAIVKSNVILYPIEDNAILATIVMAILAVDTAYILYRMNLWDYFRTMITIARLRFSTIFSRVPIRVLIPITCLKNLLIYVSLYLPLCVILALPIGGSLKIMLTYANLVIIFILGAYYGDENDAWGAACITTIALGIVLMVLSGLWMMYVKHTLEMYNVEIPSEDFLSKVEYIIDFSITRFILEFLTTLSIILTSGILVDAFSSASLVTPYRYTIRGSQVIEKFVKLRDKFSREVKDILIVVTSWYSDFSVRNTYMCRDMMSELGVCITSTTDTNKVFVGLSRWLCCGGGVCLLCMKVPQKLEKKTSTLYQTVFLLVTERGSTLLNVLVVVDRVVKTIDVLYLKPEDVDKPIEYLDLYTMGIVDSYEQYLKLKSKIDLIET